ncbi:MAG TPA: sulfotransferase family protein, partial [Porticoccus sp.]|nr:sulfotransferase family protein [Porticoccus sp.]
LMPCLIKTDKESIWLLSLVCLFRSDRNDLALQQYKRAIELEPKEAGHYYNLATVQRFLGDFESADKSLQKVIELNPQDYDAHYLRSDLKRQTKDSNHIDSLSVLIKQGIKPPKGHVKISYALAKELEDIENFSSAFKSLQQGADIRRKHMQYSAQNDLATIKKIQQVYQSDMFEGKIAGCDNAEPIFIIGMPRTGTTLVERIIGSHSSVSAAGELPNFSVEMMQLVKRSAKDRNISREDLVELTASLSFKDLGKYYVESTRPMTGHCERFIDKLPFNYLYAGLIHLALPNAKIINLKRHPLDTCYAIYKTLFEDVYPFSYDLEELAHYYVAYQQLMEHWNRVLPGIIHTVNYEDLVTDIDTQSRALLGFCELEWEDQCLSFHQNTQASTTASAAQVRQPVYTSSVGKWRRYEKQLQPVKDILLQAGIGIDD